MGVFDPKTAAMKKKAQDEAFKKWLESEAKRVDGEIRDQLGNLFGAGYIIDGTVPPLLGEFPRRVCKIVHRSWKECPQWKGDYFDYDYEHVYKTWFITWGKSGPYYEIVTYNQDWKVCYEYDQKAGAYQQNSVELINETKDVEKVKTQHSSPGITVGVNLGPGGFDPFISVGGFLPEPGEFIPETKVDVSHLQQTNPTEIKTETIDSLNTEPVAENAGAGKDKPTGGDTIDVSLEAAHVKPAENGEMLQAVIVAKGESNLDAEAVPAEGMELTLGKTLNNSEMTLLARSLDDPQQSAALLSQIKRDSSAMYRLQRIVVVDNNDYMSYWTQYGSGKGAVKMVFPVSRVDLTIEYLSQR